MLNNTYTVGAGAYAWTFTKQGDDNQSSQFSVAGLPVSAARNMSVQHQQMKNKTNRHMVDMSATYSVPGSSTGAMYSDRVYLVVQRSPYTSEADIKGHIATFLALAGTAAFQTSVLNGEK